MRQRQPDGADLLPSRRQAVDDAPRDDEVGARVVVRERETGGCVMKRGSGAGGTGSGGDDKWQPCAKRNWRRRGRYGTLRWGNARSRQGS